MAEYYCLVKFVDTEQRYVVLSTTILNFKPEHPDDFCPVSIYRIAWQESDGSFDGYYDGFILCQAGSLEELKTKAGEAGIKKMPPNFQTMLKEVNGKKKAPTSVAQRKSASNNKLVKRKSQSSNPALRAKKLKMEETLNRMRSKVPFEENLKETSSETSKDCYFGAKAPEVSEAVLHHETTHDVEDMCAGPEEFLSSQEPFDSDGSEDSTSKLLDSFSEMKQELQNAKNMLEEVQDKSQKDLSSLKSTYEEKLRLLKMSVKVSEERRLSLEAKEKSDQTEIKRLSTENLQLKDFISTAFDILRTGMTTYCTSDVENKSAVSAAQRKLIFSSPQASSSSYASLPSKTKVSKSEGTASPDESNVYHVYGSTGSSVQRIQTDTPRNRIHKLRTTAPSPLMLEISEAVRQDITGEKPLPVTSDGKVIIGGGIEIPKRKWEDAIKNQTKSSFFVKRLGQSVYGHEGLKCRTVSLPGRKKKEGEAEKQLATPSKVDAIVACLRGKLLAEDPETKQVDALADRARVILSEKMQDEARERPSPRS